MERWLSCLYAVPWFGACSVSLSAGCKAQSPPSTASNNASPVPTPQLNRRIEVLVRSQFEVPPNVDVAIGATSKSEFPGFENLPITFSSNGKQTVVNFLLSSDGNTVARLERFDISHSPADMISIQNRPLRGTPDAKVTIVNFDDLECPYCARMHEQLFPATLDRYKGLVKFYLQGLPAGRNPSLGHACGGERELPRRPERRSLLEVCGLCAFARGRGHRTGARCP